MKILFFCVLFCASPLIGYGIYLHTNPFVGGLTGGFIAIVSLFGALWSLVSGK